VRSGDDPRVDDTELTQRADDFQRCIEKRDRSAAELLHPDDALELVHPTAIVMPRAR
jgi:hypothetical protein